MYDKIILVTRTTRLDELIARFNTRPQAKFYIEHMGLSFEDYDREHEIYSAAVSKVRSELEQLAKLQAIDRGFLPNFLFGARDLVVTLGQDGLVVNTAKYLDGQPIVAINPDPKRFDGLLLPFLPSQVRGAVEQALSGKARFHRITMAEVALNDGQQLLAFNDFFVGQRTHVSARYRLSWQGRAEEQSSSGILVSTGAGSTGWLSSTQNMATGVARFLKKSDDLAVPTLRLGWDDPRLAFVVREPFRSKVTGVDLVAGLLEPGQALEVESHMPENGVIFSDGIEADALAFNSGAVATIRKAKRETRLVAA